MLKKILNIVLLGLFFVVLSPLSVAAKNESKNKEKSEKYQCQLISRGEAIAQAKRKIAGKVVGVQLKEKGSRSVYRVRMLVDKKRVKTISINACR